AFKALHRSAAHPHPAPHTQIWMRFHAGSTREALPQAIDFGVRQDSGLAVEAHQTHCARQLQNSKAVLNGEANKNIAGKQSEFQYLAAIFPAAYGTVERQKTGDRALFDLLRYAFLVA